MNEKQGHSQVTEYVEQGANMAHPERGKVHVHLNLHPLVSLIITSIIGFILLVSWAFYGIEHPKDFSAATVDIFSNGPLVIKGVAFLLVLWLAVHVAGHFIERVMHPLIRALHMLFTAIGQLRKNRVLAMHENYTVIDHMDGAQFHQVSQERTTYNYKGDLAPPESLAQLSAPGQPTQAYAISQLQHNGLQVCLGISKATGLPFVRDLIGGTHYKIIGGSGMGKSCYAASILDQVTTTNDPNHLMIGLLDLERKTSRLFENLPHIAEINLGRKRVDCIAQSPDEVGEHFGYLKQELNRRARLSEDDLQRERFLLIYIEEFLSLKFEIDPALKDQMLADFSILALRGRKYKMYLLACAQVSYADKQLRDAQAQFNVNASFSVVPSAARAAGFAAYPLLNKNFAEKKPGQLVLETTGCQDIMLAPEFDVRQKLLQMGRSNGVQDAFRPTNVHDINSTMNDSERTPVDRSDFYERSRSVLELAEMGWNKQEIVEKVWNCKKGGSLAWQEGSAAYDEIMASRKIGA